MKKEIHKTWFFKQPPRDVWEYLTKPELIEQWLMKSDFKPIVGHKFQFIHAPKNESNYNGSTQCEVLEVTPFTKLSYSWNGGTKDGTRTYNSRVEWTLIPKGTGTELQLMHNGFSALEDAIAHDSGWNKCLNLMTEHITSSSNANTNA
jgi:uncharacterized protein YndB with AHSA1/START domain